MDIDKMVSMMKSMGLPESVRDEFARDPSSFMRAAMEIDPASATSASGFGQTQTPGNYGYGWRNDLRFEEIALRAKERFEKEKDLPPSKVAKATRADLAYLLYAPQEMNQNQFKDRNAIRQTIVGALPSFSSTPTSDLKEIRIAQLLVRKTHKGFCLPCRIISRTSHIVGTDFVVEDESRDIAHVSVYRFPFCLEASSEVANSIFPMGARIVIREPTYKLSSTTSRPMIRVDSPSDILFIDDIVDNTVCVQRLFGPNLRPLVSTKTAEQWKALGTQAFKNKEWFQASIAYSEGLKVDAGTMAQILVLNRAETYIRIGWFNSALSDARRALDVTSLPAELRLKAIGRAARSLYGLGKYEDAIKFTKMLPDEKELQSIASRCLRRQQEHELGNYDWAELCRCSRQSTFRPDIANYNGPIEVRKIDCMNGQRGMFVTRDVEAGELLVVSKPIASCLKDEMPADQTFFAVNLLLNNMVQYDGYAVMTRVVERLWDDACLAKTLNCMYAGANFSYDAYCISKDLTPAEPLVHPRIPVVDVDIGRVESVCTFNAFTISPITDPLVLPGKPEDRMVQKHSSALYEIPSFCNHSCLPTANREFFGDAMVVRASINLKKGEEVTMLYFNDDYFASHSERVWGFKCRCVLCLALQEDGADVLAERESILFSLRSHPSAARATNLIRSMEKTYDKPHWQSIPVKRHLGMAYRLMANDVNRAVRTSEPTRMRAGVEYLQKMLASNGILVIFPAATDARGGRSDVIVEVKSLPSCGLQEAVKGMIQIANLYLCLNEPQDRLWVRAALKLSDIHAGGGKQLFKELYEKELLQSGCMQYVDSA